MDFGYRPTFAIEQFFIDREPEPEGVGLLGTTLTLYASHYLAARTQLVVLFDGSDAFGVPGRFILLVDQIRFDDKLGGFKRKLLGKGLKGNVEDRLEFLRSLADSKP